MIDEATRKAYNEATHCFRKIEYEFRNRTCGEWADAMDAVIVEADRLEEKGKTELCDRCGRRRLKSSMVEGEDDK